MAAAEGAGSAVPRAPVDLPILIASAGCCRSCVAFMPQQPEGVEVRAVDPFARGVSEELLRGGGEAQVHAPAPFHAHAAAAAAATTA